MRFSVRPPVGAAGRQLENVGQQRTSYASVEYKGFTSFEFDHGRLCHGDCLVVIPTLADQSVDLLVTSPPYFIGKDYDVSSSIADFREMVQEVQTAVYPKIRDGGSVCWQVGCHVTEGTMTPLDFIVHDACSAFPELKLRNRIVWTFGHGAHAKKRLSGRYETVLWYTKGDEYTFDLDSIRVPQKYPGKKHYKGPNQGSFSGNPRGKNPSDVWSIPNVKANHVEKTSHPCQFPVALAARLSKALTDDGGTVLDPFAGAGSTAIAALEAGRQFICIEIEKDYCDLSVSRVQKWYAGNLRVREDVPAMKSEGQGAVSERPPHFWNGARECD